MPSLHDPSESYFGDADITTANFEGAETRGLVGGLRRETPSAPPPLITCEHSTILGSVAVRRPDGKYECATCMRALLEEALRLLLEAEWAGWNHEGYVPGGDVCPFCDGSPSPDTAQHHVHTPDCKWLALMRRAGLR